MSRDRYISEAEALGRMAGTVASVDRAEIWLAAQIERTRERSLSDLHGRGDLGRYEAILDGEIQITEVSPGLVRSAIEERAKDLGPRLQVEHDRLDRLQSDDDTLARRTQHGTESGLVSGAPRAHYGMVGLSSPVAQYPIGAPGCAAGISRRPLPDPCPAQLLTAGWTGLQLADLARVDAIGGRAIAPQYQVSGLRSKRKTRRGKRGKRGGQRHNDL